LPLLQRLEVLVIQYIRFNRWTKDAQEAFRTAISSSLSSRTLRKLDIGDSSIPPDYFAKLINSQPLRVLRLPTWWSGYSLNLNSSIEALDLVPEVVDSILRLDPLSTNLHCILRAFPLDKLINK